MSTFFLFFSLEPLFPRPWWQDAAEPEKQWLWRYRFEAVLSSPISCFHFIALKHKLIPCRACFLLHWFCPCFRCFRLPSLPPSEERHQRTGLIRERATQVPSFSLKQAHPQWHLPSWAPTPTVAYATAQPSRRRRAARRWTPPALSMRDGIYLY